MVVLTEQATTLGQKQTVLGMIDEAQLPQDHVFSLITIDKLPLIDLTFTQLGNADQERIFKILLENDEIKFPKKINIYINKNLYIYII